MITFKPKDFSASDKRDFYNTAETAIRDLIKILVMGLNSRNANRHWVEVTSNSILGAGRSSYKNKPKLYSFLGISTRKERNNIKGYMDLLLNPNESPEEFVKRLWKDVANQKDNGILKYQGMIKPNPTDEEVLDVLEKLRFIALYLSGQLLEFNWDKTSLKTTINFDSRRIDKMSVSELSKLISEALMLVCPGINF